MYFSKILYQSKSPNREPRKTHKYNMLLKWLTKVRREICGYFVRSSERRLYVAQLLRSFVEGADQFKVRRRFYLLDFV
jgi:hypothetical protein